MDREAQHGVGRRLRERAVAQSTGCSREPHESRFFPRGPTGPHEVILGLPGGFTTGDLFWSPLVLGNILFAVVLVTVRLRRLKEGGEVAVHLQAQLAAARGVQEMLLTGSAPET